MASRSQGKLQALPQVPPRRRRDRHRHAWRGRMVGPEQRRQGRRLPTRAAPRAEPQLRRGAEDAAAPGRGSTRFHAGRARARQARPSNPGRSEMGPAPAAETAAQMPGAISRAADCLRSGPDRGGAHAMSSEKAPAAPPGSPTAIPQASSSTSTSAARPTRAL